MTRGRHKTPEIIEITKRCEELGITLTTYRRRRQTGWTKEEALSTARVGAFLRLKDGTSAYMFLKKHGKSYSTFYNYITLGYSIDEAIEKILSRKQKRGNNVKNI